MARDPSLVAPLWCTTRPARTGEVDGTSFRFLEPVKFEELERNRAFVATYVGEDGESYGLMAEDLLQASQDGSKTVVVDASVEMTRKLMAIDGVELLGVWVSLSSMESVRDRVRQAVLKANPSMQPESPEMEGLLRSAVATVVEDIEFGVSSGVFDFTILNTDKDAAVDKLLRAVSYAK